MARLTPAVNGTSTRRVQYLGLYRSIGPLYYPSVRSITPTSGWYRHDPSSRCRRRLSRPGQPDPAKGARATLGRTGDRQRAGGAVRHAAPVVRAASLGARAQSTGEVEEA